MIITEFPDLVGYNIAKFCSAKTLLTLRQVCTITNGWTSEVPFGRDKNETIPYRLSSFATFTDIPWNLSLNYFEINNTPTGPLIYEDVGLQKFLKEFGPSIKKLKVGQYSACVSPAETHFYESLPSLEELEIDHIFAENEERTDPTRVPETFKNLKVLRLNTMCVRDWTCGFGYLWRLLRKCERLETLPKPYLLKDIDGISDHPNGKMGHIMDIVQERFDKGCPVKYVDMDNFPDVNNIYSFDFLNFGEICRRTGTMMLNVQATLLDNLIGFPPAIDLFDNIIFSLVNLSAHVRGMHLSKLEEIEIRSSKECFVMNDEVGHGYPVAGEWPSLKIVSVHFDTDTTDSYEVYKIQEIISYLFDDFERFSVEQFKLSFERNEDGSLVTNCGRAYFPDFALSIGLSFGFLKILIIKRWDAMNKEFIKLWDNLREGLQELDIEDCRTLGNSGFIGRDVEDPMFLKMTSLKKLRLGSLDTMPKITDRLFRDVLCKMQLSELILTSSQPLKKISGEGILALVDTPFSKSVEYFPFRNWSMEAVEPSEFHKLKNLFECNL